MGIHKLRPIVTIAIIVLLLGAVHAQLLHGVTQSSGGGGGGGCTGANFRITNTGAFRITNTGACRSISP
jgi:hypothetical protein